MSDRSFTLTVNGKDNASKIIGGVNRSLVGMKDNLLSMRGLIAGALGGFAVSAVWSGLKSTAEAMDEVGKASDRIGIATESLIGLKWAADQSGNSLEDLERGMVKMSRNIAEAAAGTGKATADSLGEIGLSAEQLLRLRPEQQLGKIADGLNAVENQADKIRIAMDIFGRTGADLLNFLNEGSEGFEKFRKEAEETGQIFSREEAAKMEVFNDQLNKMAKSFSSLKIAVAGMAAPDVITGAKIVTDLINGVDSVETDAFLEGLVFDADRLAIKRSRATGGFLRGADAATREERQAKFLEAVRNNPRMFASTNAPEFLDERGLEEYSRLRGQAQQPAHLAIEKFGEFFAAQEPAGKKAAADEGQPTPQELLGVVNGIQGGFMDLVGVAERTGVNIGSTLATGVETGWEQRKQAIKDRITEIQEAVKTPQELLIEGLAEVEMLTKNGLSEETAERQRRVLRRQFSNVETETRLAARESRFLTRAPGGSSPELEAAKQREKQRKIAEQQLAVAKQMADDIRRIRDDQPATADF